MNPVEIEIFNHLFQSVAEEMGVTLMRAAFSSNIKERRDFSCALFDRDGELLAQAAHIPVHLGSMPLSVQAAIEGVEIGVGDSVFLNDPFRGGTHLPDVTVVTPVWLTDVSQPAFYVANRAHHADVGGIASGSLPLSRHIDDEGIRFGPTRLTPENVDLFCRASRTPEERRGDLSAQVAANRVGVQRMEHLLEKHSSSTLLKHGVELRTYAARLMESVIENIPDGDYSAVDFLDGDGFDSLDIQLSVLISVRGSRLKVDFTQTDDQVAGPVNAVRAITLSAVFYVMRCLGPEDMPTNAGCMAPVILVTRPGSLVDAQYPAPVAAGNVETSQRIVDVILRALSEALPKDIPAASAGSMNNVALGGIGPAGPFVYYETIGGGSGAGPGWNGMSGVHTHMTNTLNTPIEALEHAFPLRITAYHLRRDSGGKGMWTGGDGLIREYEFEGPTEVTVLSERHRRGPYGLKGGQNGRPGKALRILQDGSSESIGAKGTVFFEPGQRLRIETPGGGGFGPKK